MGQSKLSSFKSLEDAKKDFEKKFRDKTKNSWADRDQFVAHPGKYTLIEVHGQDDAQEAVVQVKWRGRVGEPWTGRGQRGPAGWALPLPSCATSGTDHPPLASVWPICVYCLALLQEQVPCLAAPALYICPLP